MNAIPRPEGEQLDAPAVSFTLDGREVTGLESETILEIADRQFRLLQAISNGL